MESSLYFIYECDVHQSHRSYCIKAVLQDRCIAEQEFERMYAQWVDPVNDGFQFCLAKLLYSTTLHPLLKGDRGCGNWRDYLPRAESRIRFFDAGFCSGWSFESEATVRHLTLPQGVTPSWLKPSAIGQTHTHYHLHNPELARSLCDWAIKQNIEVWEHSYFPRLERSDRG